MRHVRLVRDCLSFLLGLAIAAILSAGPAAAAEKKSS